VPETRQKGKAHTVSSQGTLSRRKPQDDREKNNNEESKIEMGKISRIPEREPPLKQEGGQAGVVGVAANEDIDVQKKKRAKSFVRRGNEREDQGRGISEQGENTTKRWFGNFTARILAQKTKR